MENTVNEKKIAIFAGITLGILIMVTLTLVYSLLFYAAGELASSLNLVRPID